LGPGALAVPDGLCAPLGRPGAAEGRKAVLGRGAGGRRAVGRRGVSARRPVRGQQQFELARGRAAGKAVSGRFLSASG